MLDDGPDDTTSPASPAKVRSKLILIEPDKITHDEGVAYRIVLPTGTPDGDNLDEPIRSRLRLFENGVELLPGHATHADVRRIGLGRFSHWGTQLLFSTSDNRSPKSAGRQYHILLPSEMLMPHRQSQAPTRSVGRNEGTAPRLVVHVGYPKTATTTFQQHVFPGHPEICYLGKKIPDFRYVEPTLYTLVEDLVQKSTIEWDGPERLRETLRRLQDESEKTCVLLSSESFIHPSAIDVGLVAERLALAARPCKILITIREQIASILSWYWTHGRHALYLTIGSKDLGTDLAYPFSLEDWLMLERSAPFKNYIATLHYDKVVSHYENLFGPENVRVLLFEQFGRDRPDYVAGMADWLGVDATTVGALAASRHENRSENRASPWQSQDADKLKTSHAGGDGPGRAPVDEVLNDLRAKFASGNTRMAARLGLPLARYGYAVQTS